MEYTVFLLAISLYYFMERFVEEINGRKTIYYKENGLYHNSNGPAIYKYFPTGELKSIEYYRFGEMFRENDLPNYVQFYRSNRYFIKEWRNKKKQLHRLTGPAKILYYDNPNDKPWNEYYIDGNYFPYWLPKIVYGKVKEPLTKSIIMKAFLFNREYGKLLKDIYDNLP